MSLDQLIFPDTWKVTPISRVVFFQEGPGVRKFQYTDSGVKLLNGGNINNGVLNLKTTERFISDEEAYGKYKHFLVEDGDLLIACSGVVVEKFDGKIAYANEEDLPLCMNTSTMRFQSLDSKILHLDYFRWFLQTSYFKRQLQQLITGSAQLNFGPSHIKQMTIPLLPLETQKQIAAVLEKADQLRKDCQQMEKELNSLAQSVFIDMFGDPVTNPKGWPKHELKDLLTVKHGYAFKSEFFTSEGKHVLLTPGNFHEEGGYWDRGEKQKFYAGKIPEDYVLDKGNLLLAMTEQAAGLLGSSILIPESEKFLHNQRLGLVKFKDEKQNSVFYSYLFNTKSVRLTIHSTATGTKVRHTSPTKLEAISVGIPPYELQNKFEITISAVKKDLLRNTRAKIEYQRLFNALIQKAFKGELNLHKSAA